MDIFYIIVLLVLILGGIFVLVYYTRFDDEAPSQSCFSTGASDEVSMDIELLGDEQMREDESQDRVYNTYIASVSYHCKASDADVFVGFVTPQPDNPVDMDAIVVVNNKGKRLGYIAKKEHEDFKRWSNGKIVPCVGHISVNEDGTLHSNLKCIRPYTVEFIAEEIQKYIDWWKKTFLNE